MPATIQRRRVDGAVPSPLGKRWITHSMGQPRAKPAPARGRTNSMAPDYRREPARDCRLRRRMPDVDRHRGRGCRDDRGLAARGGGRRGDAARAGRAGIGRDGDEPGPGLPARPRGARPLWQESVAMYGGSPTRRRVRIRPRTPIGTLLLAPARQPALGSRDAPRRGRDARRRRGGGRRAGARRRDGRRPPGRGGAAHRSRGAGAAAAGEAPPRRARMSARMSR